MHTPVFSHQMAGTQLQTLQDRLPTPQADDATQPRVVIPSALKLTRDQEEALMQMSVRREKELTDEQGRIDFTQPNWAGQISALVKQGTGMPHFAKRHLSHLVYQGIMDWRPTILGGIWQESNQHLPFVRRIVQQQIARANAYFFGTKPWFTASASPYQNPEYASRVTEWARHESDEAKLDSTLGEAVRLAFIQGECVTKTIYEKIVSYYKTYAEIGVYPNGEPFITQSGDYVYKNDVFVQMQSVNVEGNPVVQTVLKRDGITPAPAEPLQWKRELIDRRIIHFAGAKARNIHYQDFLCPLTAPDIQRADSVFHIYSEPVIQLVNRLLQAEWTAEKLTTEQQLDKLAKLTSALSGGTMGTAKASAEQPRAELKESEGMLGNDKVEPECAISEGWHHFDVNNDGVLESIVLLRDSSGTIPIYYDYAANVTQHGLRPFRAHVVNKVAGRWHGQGQVETLYPLQHFADLLLNRWNFTQMSAARVDFWNPNAVEEGANNKNLKFNWGRTYTLKANMKAEDALASVYLRDIKSADVQSLLQTVNQMLTNMSGVANVNDSQMAGLDTAQLATGVKNLEQSGEELFGAFIMELSPSIEDSTEDFLTLTLAHLEAPRIFRYFAYDEAAKDMVQKVGAFSPADARDLRLDVNLELSRYKSQQQAAQSDAAWKVGTEYYQQQPQAQGPLAELAKQRLKSLQIRNVDRIIVPTAISPLPPVDANGQPLVDPNGTPVSAPAAPGAPAQPQVAPQPLPPPAESVEI